MDVVTALLFPCTLYFVKKKKKKKDWVAGKRDISTAIKIIKFNTHIRCTKI